MEAIYSRSVARRTRLYGAAVLGIAMLLARPCAGQELGRGLLWSSPPAAGESWKPTAVSIGNHGTQVFAHLWGSDTHSKLFSAHDSGTPSAVWTRLDPAYSTTSSADSATWEDLHIGMHQHFLSGTSGPQAARVTAFRSASATPEWQYTLPVSITNHTISSARVSDHGDVVVAYAHDSAQSQLEVAVLRPLDQDFDPDDTAPVHYSILPTGYALEGSDLSADGSTLALSYSTYLKIYDTASGTVVFTQNAGAGTSVTEAVAVSGDGGYVARGISQGFQLYRRIGTSDDYVLHFQHSIAQTSTCTALDISEDGSTIVAGFTITPGTSVRMQAVNISNHAVETDWTFTGNGTLSNEVADIAVSADGNYFVAGCWGDGTSSMPELAGFIRGTNAPAGVYDQPGSVVDVDITGDGRRFVAGVRSNHVSIGGSGGRIECYNLVDRDMGLDGVPSLGSVVDFHWRTPAGSTFAILLRSREFTETPETVPGITGSLYLPRGGITFLPGTIGLDGIATCPYPISGIGDSIGSSLYFQGYAGSPRALTEDWIKLTILP